jgi:hypothetical protein
MSFAAVRIVTVILDAYWRQPRFIFRVLSVNRIFIITQHRKMFMFY